MKTLASTLQPLQPARSTLLATRPFTAPGAASGTPASAPAGHDFGRVAPGSGAAPVPRKPNPTSGGPAPVQLKSKAWKKRRRERIAQRNQKREEARAKVADYRVDPHAAPTDQIEHRKELIKGMGLSKDSFPSSKINLDGWHGNKEDLIGSHHKFPKRTLATLFDSMEDHQKGHLRQKLGMDKDAGPKALARLRSNLIPPGPEAVAPETRKDDPEHTGEMLDLVTNESGTLTPRSRTYANLALHTKEIAARLQAYNRKNPRKGKLTDKEANVVTNHLRQAEEWHHAIEGSPHKAADYGGGFWRNTGGAPRKYQKGAAPNAKYIGKNRDAASFEAAHEDFRKDMARKAKEKADLERAAREQADKERRERALKPSGKSEMYVPRDTWGKSARFW